MLGRFINQQFLFQEYTSQLAWNPFAPTAMPDAWLSANVPRLGQTNIFNPLLQTGFVSTAAAISSGSPAVTVTSANGIYPGMFVSAGFLGANYFKLGTVVSTVSGTTITLSSNALGTNVSAPIYFSYKQYPNANVFYGDLYFGPGLNNTTAGLSSNIFFTSLGDGFPPTIEWEDQNGQPQWGIRSDTRSAATGGYMEIGNFPGANSSGLIFGNGTDGFVGAVTVPSLTISSLSSGILKWEHLALWQSARLERISLPLQPPSTATPLAPTWSFQRAT